MGQTTTPSTRSSRLSPPSGRRLRTALRGSLATLALFCAGPLLGGCSTHHWAEVKASKLPHPPTERVLHTGRLIIEVTEKTEETQCVVYQKYSPVCFYNVRPAVEQGLVRGLWPSYPDVELGNAAEAREGDYVLQVEMMIDALPPDDRGPGWSAGVRGRYRLMRDGQVLREATLASRSRADLPYGAPLGLGATDVIDAAIVHITTSISALPETQPDEPVPLPMVAAREVKSDAPDKEASAPEAASDEPGTPASRPKPPAKQAKSVPTASFDEKLPAMDSGAPPPPARLE